MWNLLCNKYRFWYFGCCTIFQCKILSHRNNEDTSPFVSERVNNFPPLPQFLRIKSCFYHNIEEEIPAVHQQLVRRVYTLWMSKYFDMHSLSNSVFVINLSAHLWSSHLCSVFRHAVHKCDRVYRLVGRGWKCHKLWLLPALAHPLQPL